MSQNYNRVLPRDLFNEANLLKCIGKLVLMIEDGLIQDLIYHHDGGPFVICQNEASGALYVANVEFFSKGGHKIDLQRPLNSRDHWPLYLNLDDDAHEVFNDAGELLIKDFKTLLD